MGSASRPQRTEATDPCTVPGMPSQSFNVLGVVVNGLFVERLGELVKPYSLHEHRQWLQQYQIRALSDPDRARLIAGAEESIAAGGTFRFAGGGYVTDSHGVLHRWSSDEEPNLELFDDLQSAEFGIEAGVFGDMRVVIRASSYSTSAEVTAKAEKLAPAVQGTRDLLEAFVDQDRFKTLLPPFKVFIGHGGDRKWEAVRDYISPHHEVVAFESDDRVGRGTLEVVEDMISQSTVAVIVMTGVEHVQDGRLLARQNVAHELGFSHGRLGARQTIILLEDGTEQLSNIAGITQIRFASGEIHTTSKEVLAAIANRKRDRDESMIGPS